MIVTAKDFENQTEDDPWIADYVLGDQECFYCQTKLVVPFIFWASGINGLLLHPDCARRLAIHLLRDANQDVVSIID